MSRALPAQNNNNKLSNAPPSATFARWDDPLGRYAHTYTAQAESLLAKLKAIAGSINDQLQHQEKLRKEAEERDEKIKYSSPSKNTNTANQLSLESSASESMIFPNTTKIDLLIARLEQQLLVGNRLRKIIEHYSVQPSERISNSGSTSNSILSIVGGVAWCAVAGQVKAALAGYLQQLRLDILCALSVLMEAERRRANMEIAKRPWLHTTSGASVDHTANSAAPASFGVDEDPAESLVNEVAKSFFTINNEIYRLVNDVAGPLVDMASTSVSSVMENMMTFA